MIGKGRKAFLFVSQDVISLVHRRHRYKPKWAVQLKSKSKCQKALDHFDAFYKPVYGDLWPPTRLSLLSLPKHCAVLNKYTDINKVTSRLESIGTLDILETLREENVPIQPSAPSVANYFTQHQFAEDFEQDPLISSSQNNSVSSSVKPDIDLENTSEYELKKKKGPSDLHYVLSADSLEPFDEDLYKDNLDAFVPPERVLSVKEQRVEEEIQAVSFQSKDIDVNVIPMKPIHVPKDLKVFVFPRGDMSRFPQPKAYNHRTGYYLMDAGSILPVIAMNLNSSDRVLDLCAAPGGKSIAMLQALDFNEGGELHCNDVSQSRIVRLKNVFSSYLPQNVAQQASITCVDGVAFQPNPYDKILVDVPCNSDRHVVTEEDNNLFKQSRNRERLQLMRVQTNLLVSAIKLCHVGGSVVYATCTMAPAQNDGVIQAAVEVLSETTNLKVAVEDLSPVSSAFKEYFNFYDKCRFGQLILPSLGHNFGPTFFAKLRRIH